MYLIALTSTLCFVPASVLAVYIGNYVVWPMFLKTKRYFAAAVAFVLVFAGVNAINFFASGIFHSAAFVKDYDVSFAEQKGLGYLNSIWAITIMGVGLFIKISKEFYLQQRENLEIAKRNIRTQLHLEKSKLRPAYLYSSLNEIQVRTNDNFDGAGDMILKLSDVLSYSLYESDSEFVPLEIEIAALLDFAELEKLKHNGIETIQIEWDTPGKYLLPPLLILSCIQEIVAKDQEQEITVSIKGNGEALSIHITTALDVDVDSLILKTDHRLEMLYEREDFELDYASTQNEQTMIIAILHQPASENVNTVRL